MKPDRLFLKGPHVFACLVLILSINSCGTPTAVPQEVPSAEIAPEMEAVEVVVEAEVEPEAAEAALDGFSVDFAPAWDSELKAAIPLDPFFEDPANNLPFSAAYTSALWLHAQCLSAPLSRINGELYADSVTHWETGNDYSEYWLHFDLNRIWSDGNSIRAQDYADGMLYTLAPENYSPHAYLLYPIAGALDYHNGSGSPDDVGIRAIDDRTLQIQLTSPDSGFAYVLSSPAAWPYREDWDYSAAAAGDLSSLPCSGHYVIADYLPEDYLSFSLLDGQMGADQIPVSRVQVDFLPDKETMFERFEAAAYDWITIDQLPADYLAAKHPVVDYALHAEPYPAVWALHFNTASPLLEDPSVRRSLAMGTPTQLAETCGIPHVASVDTLVDGIYEQVVPFDPSSAREKVAGMTLTLLIYEGSERQWLLVDELVRTWQSLLDVELDVSALPYSDYYQLASICKSEPDSCDFDLYFGSIGAPSDFDPRPDALLRSLSTHAPGKPLSGWQNERFEQKLLEAAAAEGEPRLELLAEAQHILLYDDPAFIPLVQFEQFYAAAPALAYVPLQLQQDPGWNLYAYFRDIWRLLFSVEMEALNELANSLIKDMQQRKSTLVTDAHSKASDALLSMRGDVIKSNKVEWEKDALEKLELDKLVFEIGGITTTPISIAEYLIKRAAKSYQKAQDKEFSAVLDQLQKSLEAAAQEGQTQTHTWASGKNKLRNQYFESEEREKLLALVLELLAESEVDWSVERDGKVRFIMPEKQTFTQSDIEAVLWIELDKLTSGDLWKEPVGKPFWRNYNSPAENPPNSKVRWQHDKYPWIAARMNQLGYFGLDPVNPSVKVVRRMWKVLCLRMDDYHSGIKMVTIGANAKNVESISKRCMCENAYTSGYVPGVPIWGIQALKDEKLYWPVMFIKIIKKDPDQDAVIPLIVEDGAGNVTTVIIKK